MKTAVRQLPLALRDPPRRGGKRVGAGRKPNGPKALVSHVRRATHVARHPLHVTLRAREGLPSFRRDKLILAELRRAIASGQSQRFRVIHFSIQSNHMHFIVEATNTQALSRGMQGLTIRLAKGVNRALLGHGRVFPDRYDAHTLQTPRETRNALLYVLQNWAKHGKGGAYDPLSSAQWFDGWTRPPPDINSPALVSAGRTWLVTIGWRRHGRLRPGERPASAGTTRRAA